MDNTKSYKHNISILLLLILSPLFLQNITLIGFGSAGLKVFHLSVALFGIFWLHGLKFNTQLMPVLLLFSIWVLIGFAVGVKYGISPLILNYIFILALTLAVSTQAEMMPFELFRRTLAWIVVPAFCYVILNIVLNIDQVIAAQAFNIKFGGRPIIPNMLFSGGWNIEASFLALLTVLFVQSRLFFFFLSVTFLVSVAYLSRTGLVLVLILLMYWGFFKLYERASSFLLFIILPFVFILLFVAFIGLGYYLDVAVVKRLFIIGSEPGSQGRLNILQYVVPGLLDSYFLGYGPGNSMDKLIAMGLETKDNNLHNYYLQVLMDFGFLGLLAFVVFICYFLLSPLIVLEFKLFFSMYLIASLVQFRGAEPLVWGILMWAFLVRKPTPKQATTEQTILEKG